MCAIAAESMHKTKTNLIRKATLNETKQRKTKAKDVYRAKVNAMRYALWCNWIIVLCLRIELTREMQSSNGKLEGGACHSCAHSFFR